MKFKEWMKKNVEVEVGKYKLKIDDLGNSKILISASSGGQLVDSKKEVKKMIDLSDLEEPKQTGLSLSAPLMEPYNNRNTW